MIARGVHRHAQFKLGMRDYRRDPRNLRLSQCFRSRIALPIVPSIYSYEEAHPDIPLPMFANDRLGCCVISGRAHWTLALEKFEQGRVLNITDTEIENQYFAETGGKDSGLNPEKSLNVWRQQGWMAGGKRYNIHLWGDVDPKNKTDVISTIYLLEGAGFALQLPKSAQSQIGKTWDVAPWWRGGRAGSWGGHWVTARSYNPTGPVCITWGAKQQMTWEFVSKYCVGCYGIVDERDKWLGDSSPVDIAKAEQYLKEIRA